MLRRLIEDEGVPNRVVPVEAATREDFSVTAAVSTTHALLVSAQRPSSTTPARSLDPSIAETFLLRSERVID
jgi:hypothetical protein